LRHRYVVAATLVLGSAVLAATLATKPGSSLFYVLGFVSAAVWIAGSAVAGPIVWRDPDRSSLARSLGVGAAVGAACFAGFVLAKFAADGVPYLAHSVDDVLRRADAGPRPAVLLVALVSGAGEELFFRGALYDAVDTRRPVAVTTLLYALVTLTTGHAALVAAALAMGLVFGLERLWTRGVLVPVTTHLVWSTLVLFFLPR
jgi:membrane protease YdiL (CAAX protease family)